MMVLQNISVWLQGNDYEGINPDAGSVVVQRLLGRGHTVTGFQTDKLYFWGAMKNVVYANTVESREQL
jgi:hypothetical protein